MPKENKKRGRRDDMKLKRQDDGAAWETSKRQKSEDEDHLEIVFDDRADIENCGANLSTAPGPVLPDIPFYGLLDEDEQEYFKRADSMLELNQFANPEERNLFLASVYKEARGKELKIVNSQSCSRLMERLIQASTPSQLKALFQKFNGHFLHLAQHRFASHCCETLFLQCAPAVTQELMASLGEQQRDTADGEIYVSMENLFIYTLNELDGNLGYLMTDPFASHTLRVLLLVLSGRPLGDSNTVSLLQSKKKENISVGTTNLNTSEAKTVSRTVPESFHKALDKMIAETVVGLETTYLRALAMHPVGNPVLQLLLDLELSSSGKKKAKSRGSLFRKLIPEDSLEEDSSTSSFINSLAYDSVGSRLLEVIIKSAPGKTFKTLHAEIFRDKIGTLVKNDIAGFIVVKLLERLSKEDLHSAVEQIAPQIGMLVERSRTSIIKVLIERCRIRKIDLQPICDAVAQAYGADSSRRLITMLKLDADDTDHIAKDRKKLMEKQDSAKVHGSLLAQSMLESPGVLRELITDGLLAVNIATLIIMAKDQTASRMLQCSLTCSNQTLKFRRILVQRFFDHIADLATDTIGSHVVDEFWSASKGLTFIRERIALELLQNETVVRDSFPGRAVWRNWKMDIYKTKKREWLVEAKETGEHAKTGIERARERYAKQVKSRPKRQVLTAANGIEVG